MTLNVVSIIEVGFKGINCSSLSCLADGGELGGVALTSRIVSVSMLRHTLFSLWKGLLLPSSSSLWKTLDLSLCGCKGPSGWRRRSFLEILCRPFVLLQRSIVTAMSHRTATPSKPPQCLSLRLTFSYRRQHTESGIFRRYRSRH